MKAVYTLPKPLYCLGQDGEDAKKHPGALFNFKGELVTKKISKVSGKDIHKALHGSKITAIAVRHSMNSAIDSLHEFAKRVTMENCSEFEVTIEQHKPIIPLDYDINHTPHGARIQSGPEKIVVTFTDNSGVGRVSGAK